jgi:hypothetical protein
MFIISSSSLWYWSFSDLYAYIEPRDLWLWFSRLGWHWFGGVLCVCVPFIATPTPVERPLIRLFVWWWVEMRQRCILMGFRSDRNSVSGNWGLCSRELVRVCKRDGLLGWTRQIEGAGLTTLKRDFVCMKLCWCDAGCRCFRTDALGFVCLPYLRSLSMGKGMTEEDMRYFTS